MKTIALAAILLTTSATAQAPQPLLFGRYAGSTIGRTRGELWQAIECSLERWKKATCINALDASVFYANHWVRWNHDIPNDAHGRTSGAAWNDQRISINSALLPESVCPVLVHEMGHVLRRSYAHSEEDGSVSYPVTHVFSEPVSRITAGDLALVCAKQPCGCQVPE
jgi:hypothetical protein